MIVELMFSGMISLPQRGRGTAVAVDEEVAIRMYYTLLCGVCLVV